MYIDLLLQQALECGASDLHLKPGSVPTLRVNGALRGIGHLPCSASDTLALAKQLLDKEKHQLLEQNGEIDASYYKAGLGNFRISIYHEQGGIGIACRIINGVIPTIASLQLPDIVASMARRSNGLILVTGPTGSGKSTTLAAMINLINEERSCHIITLEDPIEYLHTNKKSLITQREIGRDSRSFPDALRSALRQDPDIIMIGEMRDLETISIAVTAAETGHLVLATLHTVDAAQSISRIIDVFPPHQQRQVQIQLANSLTGIISQRLLARRDGLGRIVACETLICTPAIRNIIREGKVHLLYSSIQTGAKHGMQTMSSCLQGLREANLIDPDVVQENL